MTWSDITSEQMVKGNVKTIEGRKIFNKLATCCDSDKVLKLIKVILLGKDAQGLPINMGIIVDLRNAVREELGYGSELDTDRDNAFFGKLIGDE